MQTFAFLTDLHWGWNDGKSIHRERSLKAIMSFLEDFQPDTLILGGDMLDCGMISHWNETAKRTIENLRLIKDAEGLSVYLRQMRALTKKLVYIRGNHERFLDDLTNRFPGLEGILDLDRLLDLDDAQIVPQGQAFKLGKLFFVHGDQLRGGGNPAKYAVETYDRSIRFGHFHTAQLYTKTCALDADDVKTGMGVPGLCNRAPTYGRGAPNRWSHGFLWGYVQANGNFNDYLTILAKDKFVAGGKEYRG